MTTIAINLDEIFNYEGDSTNIRSVILTKAAELLAEQMRTEAASRIEATISQVVDDEIRTIVQAALAAPIQRTSPWGEKHGKPTSVLDLARESLKKFVSASPSRRDEFGTRNGRRGPASNLAELIDDTIATALRTELQPAVKEARVQVVTRMREHLTTALAADITQLK